jgi:hypothetical protein
MGKSQIFKTKGRPPLRFLARFCTTKTAAAFRRTRICNRIFVSRGAARKAPPNLKFVNNAYILTNFRMKLAPEGG